MSWMIGILTSLVRVSTVVLPITLGVIAQASQPPRSWMANQQVTILSTTCTKKLTVLQCSSDFGPDRLVRPWFAVIPKASQNVAVVALVQRKRSPPA
ncbi:hypothetical protein QBC44DRAFT_322046 [Cladorrhinum sp. PSN332]|nr:hypothetical protein QBC44DRAFT_322046 [Cladorrhinum sp. PSN332]